MACSSDVSIFCCLLVVVSICLHPLLPSTKAQLVTRRGTNVGRFYRLPVPLDGAQFRLRNERYRTELSPLYPKPPFPRWVLGRDIQLPPVSLRPVENFPAPDPRFFKRERLSLVDKKTLLGNQRTRFKESWDYNDFTTSPVGPRGWYRVFPECGHRHQSPIDISDESVQYRPMAPISLYTCDSLGETRFTVRNNGYTANINPNTKQLLLRCNDLPADYIVAGVHFHWGKDNSFGSEHWLRGRAYPLEMHILGYNSQYSSLQDALGKDKGIHVVGVFFQVSRFSNHGLKTCIDELRNVTCPGDAVSTGQLDFSQLLPESTAPYYRYEGSLTTPPCTENIVWSIFETPQDITAEQMNEFRKLSFSVDTNPYTGGNVRPLQESKYRTIFSNNAFYSRK